MQCNDCEGKGLKSPTELCFSCNGNGQAPDSISEEEVKPIKKIKVKKFKKDN